MSHRWALQDAKNKLSQVVDKAASEGPQTITRRGQPAAVLLSIDDYRAVTRKKESLVEFFRRSPFRGVKLDLERDPDTGRDVDL